MNAPKDLLLVIASGGMLLCCFHACTAFLLACLSHNPLPLSHTAGIIILAALLTFCHHRRGWRRIQVITVHSVGLLFSISWICHRYFGVEAAFWRFGWVPDFMAYERDAAGGLVLFGVLICVGILWRMGRRLSTRPTDPTTICHRFDLGLGYLLGLFTIKLLVAVKENNLPMAHASFNEVLTFLLFGLLAMGIVRIRNEPHAIGTTYLKGAGAVMSFGAVTFGLGGGLFLLFLSELQKLADMGGGVLKTVAAPLGPMVVGLIRFLYSGFDRNELLQASTGGGVSGGSLPAGDIGVYPYLVMVITLAIPAVTGGFVLYQLVKWLYHQLFMSRVAEKDGSGLRALLLSWLHAARWLWGMMRAFVLQPRDRSGAAQRYYRRLRLWGRFSGLPPVVFETPREFGRRLAYRFPGIKNEIAVIIRMHDEAVYGRVFPDQQRLCDAKLALRRMRTPSLWSARLRSLFFQDRM